MKNIIGNTITLTVFGESHGPFIGGVLDGLPAGLSVDMEYIMKEMDKRKSVSALSTPRKEADTPQFISGVRNGYTEGTPVAFIIANGNTDSSAYDNLRNIARPGHADYTAQMKYGGYQDARGGGHFSGRLTAVIVAAGAIVRQALEAKGILIGTHISDLNGITDVPFSDDLAKDITALNDASFAVISDESAALMQERILKARSDQDSVGGILETAVTGLEPGIGEPLFGSIESELAKAIFSVGGVKGIEFGKGFGFAHMTGSEANDPFRMDGDKIITVTNNNGGINGGISNGMPVIFRTAVKPTPSIAKSQQTVDFGKMEDTQIEISGRHDPAIIHRARAVIDSLTALVIADLICQRYGYMWLQ